MGRISLEGLEFHAFHGVYQEERVQGNRFTVDVHIDTDFGSAANKDDLSGTIDYSVIAGIVKDEMDQPRGLLEALANCIGRRILQTFPKAEQIIISISKHNPPIGFTCARSTVTMVFPTRDRK
ncbi:MAG: dihydroneopterin aldolase [Bacteroidota bacterium]